jgi:chorismate mutase
MIIVHTNIYMCVFIHVNIYIFIHICIDMRNSYHVYKYIFILIITYDIFIIFHTVASRRYRCLYRISFLKCINIKCKTRLNICIYICVDIRNSYHVYKHVMILIIKDYSFHTVVFQRIKCLYLNP